MKYNEKHPKIPKNSLRKKEAKRGREQRIEGNFLSVVSLVQSWDVAGHHIEGCLDLDHVTVVKTAQDPLDSHNVEGKPGKVPLVKLSQVCAEAGPSVEGHPE